MYCKLFQACSYQVGVLQTVGVLKVEGRFFFLSFLYSSIFTLPSQFRERMDVGLFMRTALEKWLKLFCLKENKNLLHKLRQKKKKSLFLLYFYHLKSVLMVI